MEAIILAGGLGSRLKGLTADIPKPMLPVGKKPFLCHLMDYWQGQGISRFILGLGYLHEAVKDYFRKNPYRTEIVYSVENELLGTGGGLRLALNHLRTKTHCLVLNGDTLFEVPLRAMESFHCQKKAGMTLALHQTFSAGRYEGVRMDSDSRILGWIGRQDLAASPFFNGGVYLLDPKFFNEVAGPKIGKFSLESEWLPSCTGAEGHLFGYPCPGRFIDIGTPEDYDRARKILGNPGT